jgi:hypothetical protein
MHYSKGLITSSPFIILKSTTFLVANFRLFKIAVAWGERQISHPSLGAHKNTGSAIVFSGLYFITFSG